MLNTETKTKLEGFGFDVSKLEVAVKSDKEESLDVPNLKTEADFSKMITEDQKTQFGSNRFEDGKKAMSEIKAKEFKEKYSLEIDGKDLDTVVEAYGKKTVVDAGIEPDKKVQSLTTQIDTLKTSLATSEGKIKTNESEYSQNLFNLEQRNQVVNFLPKETVISHEDIIALFFSGHRVTKDEQGRTAVKKGENLLKDQTTGDPLPLKDVVTSFVDERKFAKNGGMGGGDGDGGGGGSTKFKNFTDFEAYCDKNKLNSMSEEAQKILKDNKAEDFKYERTE